MAFILADAGNIFTWSGSDYACIVTDREKGKKLEEGGFLEEFDLSIQTRASLFDTLPAENQTVTHNSQLYRIGKVRINQSAKILTLLCMSATK